MDLGLNGKVALVLAAGGGLGASIAATLAGEGAKVCLSDINADALSRVAGDIQARGGWARTFAADLGDQTQLKQMIGAVESAAGPVDILVNITGGPPASPSTGVAADQWTKAFEMMVLSVAQVTDLVLPSMRQRKWGRIITSTSSGVVVPIPDLMLSNALRSSLVAWSKTLSRAVAADGVTVNVVVPGRIATKRILELDTARAQREQRSLDEVVLASTSTIPMRRYGTPQEYADMVAVLASERASYVTGSIMRVDGGLIGSI